VDTVTLRPDRRGTWLALGFGIVFGAIGAAMLAAGRWIGILPLLIGLVGLYAGVGGLVPGLAGLRLDDQGLRLRSLGKSWGARWVEIESFSPTTIVVSPKRAVWGRAGTNDAVEIHYRPGIGDAHLPKNALGREYGIDERYVTAAYGGLSSAKLADLLERYRAANG
jgi:hypothetical protein